MRYFSTPFVFLVLAAVAQTTSAQTTSAQWTAQLAAQDFRIRWHAAYMLGELGPKAAEAVPALHKILEKKAEQEYVRGMAAWALGRIGPAAEVEIPLLAETMYSRGHIAVRRNSVEALGNFGPAAKSAVDELIKLLGDDDEVTRVNTAVALWKIERHPKAVPALLEMLRKGKSPEPYHAAVALGFMVSEADATAPALIEALRADADSDNGDVRRAAARSLGQLGKAAFPALKKANALADPDAEVRRCVVESLSWMGTIAVRPLTASLTDTSPAVRRAAARSLGNVGSDAQSAEAALLAVVNDPKEKEEVRDAAFKARRSILGE